MSAIERPISAGSGSLNPVVSVLSWSAIRVLSVGTTTSYIRARPGADSTMLSSGSGGQPRGAGERVQADCGPESGTSGLRCPPSRRWLALLLAGCSSFPASMNPVSWWHDLQGGKIAEERPPPPGADQPYPNLASVPPKPEAPDRAALANIATALIADRTNAQHAAAAAPIADPSLPSASPAPVRPRHRAAAAAAAAAGGRGRRAPPWRRPTHRRAAGLAQSAAPALPTPCRRRPRRRSARCRARRLPRPARRRSRPPSRRGATCVADRPAATAEAVGRRCRRATAGRCRGSTAAATRRRPLPHRAAAAAARRAHDRCRGTAGDTARRRTRPTRSA